MYLSPSLKKLITLCTKAGDFGDFTQIYISKEELNLLIVCVLTEIAESQKTYQQKREENRAAAKARREAKEKELEERRSAREAKAAEKERIRVRNAAARANGFDPGWYELQGTPPVTLTPRK